MKPYKRPPWMAEVRKTQEQFFRLVLFTVLALASSAALARHCPADMKKIDAALAANPSLSAAQLSEVKKRRAEGEELHKAGKHKESEDTLEKAMNILNIK